MVNFKRINMAEARKRREEEQARLEEQDRRVEACISFLEQHEADLPDWDRRFLHSTIYHHRVRMYLSPRQLRTLQDVVERLDPDFEP